MKYTVTTSFIKMVGNIWMPNTLAAMDKTLSDYDIENMTDEDGNITRDSVEMWLTTHSGDFQSVTDFYADIETDKGNIIIEWENEDNEMIYIDCTYQD